MSAIQADTYTKESTNTGARPSSETQGQIAEERGSLNGRKKMATKKSIVVLFSHYYAFLRRHFLPPV